MKALVTMGCLTLAASAWAAPPPAAPKTAPQTAPEKERRAEGSNDGTANAKIINTEGKEVGEATLTQAAKGVVIHVRLFGMPEGEHAIHIHEVGQCQPPFKTAGGHFNPAGHEHGIKNPKGEHAGDLPNLFVPKSGTLETDLFTDAVTVTPGKRSVFDSNGSAIVIHAVADDYKSNPAGNAGDRIACGVIKK